MKMKNTSEHTLKIDCELLDEAEWEGASGPRPAKVTIPAGAVVGIRDEFAVRRRMFRPTTPEMPTMELPSVVYEVTGGKLTPHGAEAEALYAGVFHDELPSVQRKMAEQRRKEKADAGDRWVTREAMEAEIASKVKAAVAAVVPPTADAVPRFMRDATEDPPARK